MAASHQLPTEHDLELLSAYLDGELSGRERELLERRLTEESALRRALTEFRETVALLNELPQLKAPRNFTLDPATYGRRVSWWKRLFTLENALQLSGALGVAASVVLIVIALVANPDGATQTRLSDTAPASESVAFQPTSTPPPTMTVMTEHLEETAIAYAGDDLLQVTMAAQSTLYAAPPVETYTQPPASGAAGFEANAAPGDAPQSGMAEGMPAGADAASAITGESSISEPMAADSDPESAAAQMAEEAPAPLAFGDTGAGETFATAPDEQAEDEILQDAASMPTPTALSQSPAPASAIVYATPSTTATMMPATGTVDAAASAIMEQAAREAASDDNDTGTAATMIRQTASPTSQAVAQAPADQEASQPATKPGTEKRVTSDSDSDTPRLAIAAAAIFVLSVGLILLGRKKARQT